MKHKQFWCEKQKSLLVLQPKLTHYGLVTPYCTINWVNIVVRWHQAIARTNADLSSMQFRGIHLTMTLQGRLKMSIHKMSLKIVFQFTFKSPRGQWVNFLLMRSQEYISIRKYLNIFKTTVNSPTNIWLNSCWPHLLALSAPWDGNTPSLPDGSVGPHSPSPWPH